MTSFIWKKTRILYHVFMFVTSNNEVLGVATVDGMFYFTFRKGKEVEIM